MAYSTELIESLNKDIAEYFPEVKQITSDMKNARDGVSRLVMLDRYTFKDIEKKTLKQGDLVVLTVKEDPKFPARGIGYIAELDRNAETAIIKVDEEFKAQIDPADDQSYNGEAGHVKRQYRDFEKPMEIYYEQIAARVARGLADVETDQFKKEVTEEEFNRELASENIVPAGRVLYGAGSGKEVTYFNCYVMPHPHDSREGIGEHRKKVMEIMSRGGGVGTNGSTLRPKGALAKGVNGKSSGAVGWLDDIAKLTHLVEQGGSRRGAQMIMLSSWHPDVIEFVISKIQNPKILRFLAETNNDPEVVRLANDKLKFTPFTEKEKAMYELAADFGNPYAQELIKDGGIYSVNNPDFLTGANISVCLTDDFMAAVENDEEYELQFPDIDNYDKEQKAYYDEHWQECGDVREWPLPVKTYRKVKAKDIWQLINICATYSAEPGIFFIDNANNMTNAKAYGQKVVATNPCGEQPLAPYSVCNLLAINLANMVDKKSKKVDMERLKNTVRVGVRMGDNVIDATPYFMEENTQQALGERRIGLGVMGLADLLIYCQVEYGSKEGNQIINDVFEAIAVTAYETSIDLAAEKGEFPFLEGNREKFVQSGYMQKMPEHIREGILANGIRNSHLLTVAPTGSTGTMIGCATGLEPYFAFKYFRSGRLGKFIEVNAPIVQEYLNANPDADAENLPPFFVSAMELSPEAHADVQCIIQRWVDSSISKTVNAPRGYSVEQVQSVYERLHQGGAKGGTVYVDGSRDAQVLSLSDRENDFEDEQPRKKKVVMENTVKPLEKTGVNYGNEIGNTCPLCREGKVIDRGGCHECSNCGAQLKCGL